MFCILLILGFTESFISYDQKMYMQDVCKDVFYKQDGFGIVYRSLYFKFVLYSDKKEVANKIQNENIPKACVGKTNFVISTCR